MSMPDCRHTDLEIIQFSCLANSYRAEKKNVTNMNREEVILTMSCTKKKLCSRPNFAGCLN